MSPSPHPPNPSSRRCTWIVLAGAALLLGGACSKKKPAPEAVVRELKWQGFALGMTEKQVTALVKAKGWQWNCRKARSVLFLEGDALYSRWIKRADRPRFKRCKARRKKGVKPGPERILRVGVVFLDDRAVQLNVQIASADQLLMKKLKTRLGTPRSRTLKRYAYAAKRASEMKIWGLSRKGVTMMWVRGRYRQELVFLTTEPTRVSALRSVSTTRKED